MRITEKLLLAILAQLFASSALADSYQHGKSTDSELAGGGSFNVISTGYLPGVKDGESYEVSGRGGDHGEFTLTYNVDNGSGSTVNPALAAFFYHQGNTYYYIDEYMLAISNYNEAIYLRPNYAEAYYFRGLAYFRNGAFERALTDFQTALSKNSFSVSVSKLNTDARQKIIEVELKISETTDSQSQ
jgi:tetratricopeptide (TPR) repeat protein